MRFRLLPLQYKSKSHTHLLKIVSAIKINLVSSRVCRVLMTKYLQRQANKGGMERSYFVESIVRAMHCSHAGLP